MYNSSLVLQPLLEILLIIPTQDLFPKTNQSASVAFVATLILMVV